MVLVLARLELLCMLKGVTGVKLFVVGVQTAEANDAKKGSCSFIC